ncbi:hypothetical protein KAJ27_14235 [bacterium]|nr:hypothetical protein [bacterium]
MKKCPYCEAVNSLEREYCFKCEKPFENPVKIEETEVVIEKEQPVKKHDIVISFLDMFLIFCMLVTCFAFAEYSDYIDVSSAILGTVLVSFGLGMLIHRNMKEENMISRKIYSFFLISFLLSGIILIITSLKVDQI